jgi:hypothetical protein
MPLTLIRRPRSPRVLHDIIKDEVRAAYKQLGDEMIARLEKDIDEWAAKPDFQSRIEVGDKRWMVSVRYDKDTDIGTIYMWVDEGTAEAGGKGSKYPIVPVNAKALKFTVPNMPKTRPNVIAGIPGVVMAQGNATVMDVYSQKVMHPGITPRNFTKSLREEYMQREKVGGFRSVTEAAIKRGTRKIGKYA